MSRATQWWSSVVIAGLLFGGCGDDLVAGTETEGATGTSAETGTTEPPTPTTTMTAPTTEEPNTGTNSTTAPSTSEPTTTEPTTTEPVTSSTSSTTESTSETDTDSGDTDTETGTDTDTDTGGELMGRSVSQTVNSGTAASSPNFKMVFTLGQPTQNQGVYTSPSFKLQGGLIGANGNPP
jgi:hypothetical protein